MSMEDLVCPKCGSDRLATLEEATIWQSCAFRLADSEGEGEFELGDGRQVRADWDSYSTDDVGDTDTSGYACSACFATWHGEPGSPGALPFVPRSEWRERCSIEDCETPASEHQPIGAGRLYVALCAEHVQELATT